MRRTSVLLFALGVIVTPMFADPVISHDVSAVNGWFEWGSGSGWPYTQHRYAECWTAMRFTDTFRHGKYLNAVLKGSGTVTVYIDSAKMVQGLIEAQPGDSWRYFHGAWGNWKAKASNGHQVGTATLTGSYTLYSWNIETWVNSHYPNPQNGFYIAFSNSQGTTAYQVWVGRPGELGLMSELEPPAPRATASAWPNPTLGGASIRYSFLRPCDVTAHVFDATGRRVKSLLDGKRQGAGEHSLTWDGIDDAGHRVTAGTYLYRIETSDEVIQGKLVLQ